MSADTVLAIADVSGATLARPRTHDATRVIFFAFAGLTLAVLAWTAHVRGSLARDLTWQCDELPLLMRFTGLTGKAATDAQARGYEPSFYNWRMGALRALRAPAEVASIHTTTNFWVNLTTHLFGVTPLAGRLMPMFWSLAAAATGAWAAWTVSRDFVAAGVTALLLALSPHLCAAGVQARGYAEAVALAPVLPVLLEKLRRAPQRTGLALAALLVAIQLSLTVYTAWLYWALPVLATAWWALPRVRNSECRIANNELKRSSEPVSLIRNSLFAIRNSINPADLRVVLTLLAAAVLALMGVYTLDRWTSLNFAAGYGGLAIRSVNDAQAFISMTARQMIPGSVWLSLLIFPGIAVVWRTPCRWWLACLGLSVALMALVAARQGSAGYPRNLGVLLGPAAVLIGCGAGAGVRRASRWAAAGGDNPMSRNGLRPGQRLRRSMIAGLLGLALLAALALPAAAALRQRAYALILPDWGRMVLDVDAEPESLGPRWVCPCLANHWTLHWYRPADNLERILRLGDGDSIEVILGAQLEEFAQPTVFRENADGSAIVPDRLPPYVAASPLWRMVYGIELRRWRGVRMNDRIEESRDQGTEGPRDRGTKGRRDQGTEGLGSGIRDHESSIPNSQSAIRNPQLLEAPVLAYLVLDPAPALGSPRSGELPDAFKRFLRDIEAWDHGVVTFKPVTVEGRSVASLIAPRHLVHIILEAAQRELGLETAGFHVFRLEPMED